MSEAIWVPVLVALTAAAASVVAATLARTPYSALAARVVTLESQVDELRDQVTEWETRDRSWQAAWNDLRTRWSWWTSQPTPPPYPTPRKEHDHD